MFCRKCGEENPENAVFCRNCGERLKDDVKKAEVIDATTTRNSQHTSSTTGTTGTTSTTSSKSDSGNWIACCCIGLLLIFILSAIFSGF